MTPAPPRERRRRRRALRWGGAVLVWCLLGLLYGCGASPYRSTGSTTAARTGVMQSGGTPARRSLPCEVNGQDPCTASPVSMPCPQAQFHAADGLSPARQIDVLLDAASQDVERLGWGQSQPTCAAVHCLLHRTGTVQGRTARADQHAEADVYLMAGYCRLGCTSPQCNQTWDRLLALERRVTAPGARSADWEAESIAWLQRRMAELRRRCNRR